MLSPNTGADGVIYDCADVASQYYGLDNYMAFNGGFTSLADLPPLKSIVETDPGFVEALFSSLLEFVPFALQARYRRVTGK